MIVCSCNVLTDRQVRSALADGSARSPGSVYRCLGCKAQCGRCAPTIRKLIDADAAARACSQACHGCPVGDAIAEVAAEFEPIETAAYAVAAE